MCHTWPTPPTWERYAIVELPLCLCCCCCYCQVSFNVLSCYQTAKARTLCVYIIMNILLSVTVAYSGIDLVSNLQTITAHLYYKVCGNSLEVRTRLGSTRTWDGTGCAFDSWQYRIWLDYKIVLKRTKFKCLHVCSWTMKSPIMTVLNNIVGLANDVDEILVEGPVPVDISRECALFSWTPSEQKRWQHSTSAYCGIIT